MSVVQVELHPSKVLPVLGSAFYLLGYITPWTLPWQTFRPVICLIAVALSVPFWIYVSRGCKPAVSMLTVRGGQIIGAYDNDGHYTRVLKFRTIRVFPYYAEVDLFLDGFLDNNERRTLRVQVMRDMLSRREMSLLRRVLLTSPKNVMPKRDTEHT